MSGPFNEDTDSSVFWVQGVLATLIGVSVACVGLLYVCEVICRGKRRGGVAPTTLSSASDVAGGGGRSRDGDDDQGRITVAEAAQKYGRVACEAKLWGLEAKERRAILEAIFAKLDKKEVIAEEPSERQQSDNSESSSSSSSATTTLEDALERGIQGSSPFLIGEHTEHSVLDMRFACAICLRGYEKGEELLNGTSCSHKFHWECAMVWLTKPKKPKDHCPYCREQMITPDELKATALEVLGEDRVKELMDNERALNKDRSSGSDVSPTITSSSSGTTSTTTAVNQNQNQNSSRVRSNPMDVQVNGEIEV